MERFIRIGLFLLVLAMIVYNLGFVYVPLYVWVLTFILCSATAIYYYYRSSYDYNARSRVTPRNSAKDEQERPPSSTGSLTFTLALLALCFLLITESPLVQGDGKMITQYIVLAASLFAIGMWIVQTLRR
jgi:Ca2+/Na+ antiporter